MKFAVDTSATISIVCVTMWKMPISTCIELHCRSLYCTSCKATVVAATEPIKNSFVGIYIEIPGKKQLTQVDKKNSRGGFIVLHKVHWKKNLGIRESHLWRQKVWASATGKRLLFLYVGPHNRIYW